MEVKIQLFAEAFLNSKLCVFRFTLLDKLKNPRSGISKARDCYKPKMSRRSEGLRCNFAIYLRNPREPKAQGV
jgi:hypothetical protein